MIIMFGSTLIKKCGKGGSSKFLIATYHRITMIKNGYVSLQKVKKGFYLKFH